MATQNLEPSSIFSRNTRYNNNNPHVPVRMTIWVKWSHQTRPLQRQNVPNSVKLCHCPGHKTQKTENWKMNKSTESGWEGTEPKRGFLNYSTKNKNTKSGRRTGEETTTNAAFRVVSCIGLIIITEHFFCFWSQVQVRSSGQWYVSRSIAALVVGNYFTT